MSKRPRASYGEERSEDAASQSSEERSAVSPMNHRAGTRAAAGAGARDAGAARDRGDDGDEDAGDKQLSLRGRGRTRAAGGGSTSKRTAGSPPRSSALKRRRVDVEDDEETSRLSGDGSAALSMEAGARGRPSATGGAYSSSSTHGDECEGDGYAVRITAERGYSRARAAYDRHTPRDVPCSASPASGSGGFRRSPSSAYDASAAADFAVRLQRRVAGAGERSGEGHSRPAPQRTSHGTALCALTMMYYGKVSGCGYRASRNEAVAP